MSYAFGAIQRLQMPGQITGLDFTNDGKHWAVSFYPPNGVGPCVRLYRTAGNELVAEYGDGAQAALGVAFAFGTDLWYLEHAVGGADGIIGRLVQVLPEGNKTWGVWTSPMTRSLTRDKVGRLLGVGGSTYIVWDAHDNKLLDTVVTDAEEASLVCQGCFHANPHQLFLYGKTRGKIVLYDWLERQTVREWPAPTEFGAYVTCSPSGRYMVAQGRMGQGQTVYDLQEQKVVSVHYLAEKMLTKRFPVFSHDESLMVHAQMDKACAFRLPSFERFEGPAFAGDRTTAAAGAREAPVMAFGFGDNTVAILHLVPAA